MRTWGLISILSKIGPQSRLSALFQFSFHKILPKYVFGNTFYIPERKQRDIIFDILNRYLANTVILTRNDYGPFANREICITVLNYTVLILKQNFNKKSKMKKHQTENCSSLNQSQGSFKVGCLNILLKEKLPTELWQDNKKNILKNKKICFNGSIKPW